MCLMSMGQKTPTAPNTRPAVLPELSTKGVAPMKKLSARTRTTTRQDRRWWVYRLHVPVGWRGGGSACRLGHACGSAAPSVRRVQVQVRAGEGGSCAVVVVCASAGAGTRLAGRFPHASRLAQARAVTAGHAAFGTSLRPGRALAHTSEVRFCVVVAQQPAPWLRPRSPHVCWVLSLRPTICTMGRGAMQCTRASERASVGAVATSGCAYARRASTLSSAYLRWKISNDTAAPAPG